GQCDALSTRAARPAQHVERRARGPESRKRRTARRDADVLRHAGGARRRATDPRIPIRARRSRARPTRHARFPRAQAADIGIVDGHNAELCAMPMNKPHLEFTRVDMNTGWATPPGYPAGIQQKILASDIDETKKMGSRTRLLRFAPGTFTTSTF